MTPARQWDEELAEAARRAMANAYAPYSAFPVGAAVRLTDGDIMTGANLENASSGLSLCAETVAIAAASSAGRLRDIVAIAVAGGTGGTAITPCGRCRQMLAEAASLAGRDIPVYCAAGPGQEGAVYSVAELLPHAFSPASLGHTQED